MPAPFDHVGIPTLTGSRIRRDASPATTDAHLGRGIGRHGVAV